MSGLGPTAATRQRMLNYLQRLYLGLHFTTAEAADAWLRIASPTSSPLSKPVQPRKLYGSSIICFFPEKSTLQKILFFYKKILKICK